MQATFIKGDKHGSETDYRDYLPENTSGILRPVFNAQGYMLMQPGLTQYATGSGVDRGGIWNERFSKHLRVSGNSIIEVSSEGVVTTIGTISGSDTVSLPYSFNTQAIIASGRMYLYDNATLTEVTDSDLGNPIDGVWVNGVYFLTDGEFIYHTDTSSESAIDPLKFATAEFMPDKSLGLAKTSDNKVAVFGRYTTEYFVDVAQDNFSFRRVDSRAHKIGIVGTHCKAEMMNKFFIMGGRKEEAVGIHTVAVGSIAKISSREVDKILKGYSEEELSSSVLEARVEDNYHYLIVHLPNRTLLYNANLGEAIGSEYSWSILKTDTTGLSKWRAIHGVYDPRRSEWVYGDRIDSRIGYLDNTVSTHYDEIVEGSIATPLIKLESDSIDEIEIETIPGHTAFSDAKVFLSVTYDGVLYSKEITIPYGLPSNYSQNFIAYALGYVNDWFSIKLRFSSRSRMAFSEALING